MHIFTQVWMAAQRILNGSHLQFSMQLDWVASLLWCDYRFFSIHQRHSTESWCLRLSTGLQNLCNSNLNTDLVIFLVLLLTVSGNSFRRIVLVKIFKACLTTFSLYLSGNPYLHRLGDKHTSFKQVTPNSRSIWTMNEETGLKN
jgi:hypothetical protein